MTSPSPPRSPRAVLCDVCGRENPSQLTFCQDCGRRLKQREARGVPPTPPTGLPRVEVEAAPKSVPARARPAAPPLTFRPPPETPSPAPAQAAARVTPAPAHAAPRTPAPPAEPAAAASGTAAMVASICSHCAAPNPNAYRFCVSCGAGLRAAPVPVPVVMPSPIIAAPPAPPAPRASEEPRASESRHAAPPPAPVAGLPVVEIAPQRAERPALVSCPRCQGQSEGGTPFCRFCGAALQAQGAPVLPASPARVAAPVALEPPTTPAPHVALEGAARMGAVPSSRRARLVVIIEDGSEGERFPLEGNSVDIGRTSGDIVLRDDRYVSPRHARLTFDGTAWSVRDLGSTNGVYVRLRRPQALTSGDLLLLGLEVLVFELVTDGERGLGHAIEHGTLLFGSPAAPRPARLLQRTVEGVVRDVYHLVREETILGRETGDIVFSGDPFLSRRHAAVRRDPKTGTFFADDLGSSNGTYLAIRKETPLVGGDFVRVGQHLFRLDFEG